MRATFLNVAARELHKENGEDNGEMLKQEAPPR